MTSPSAAGDAGRGAVSVLLYVAVAVAAADAASIAYVMPVLRAEFGMGAQATSWLLTVFILGTLIGAPVGASFAGARGADAAVRASALVFVTGAVLVAWGGDWWLLLVGRLLQGLGAGPVIPLAAALVAQRYPVERRGRMLAILSLCWGLAFVLTVGVVPLVLRGGWRLIFAIEAAAAAAVWLGLMRGGASDSRSLALDVPGLVTWCGALACLSVGISSSRGGLASGRWLVITTTAGLVLAALFVVVEYRSPAPMLPLSIFRSREMSALACICVGTGLGQMSLVQFPSLAVSRLGVTADRSGAVMLPLVVAGLLGGVLTMIFLDRIGPKVLITICAATTLSALLVQSWPSNGRGQLVGASVLIGLGVAGLSGGPLRYVAARAVALGQGESAQAAVMILTNMGLLFGSAIVGSLAEASHDDRRAMADALLAVTPIMALFFLPVLTLRAHRAR